MVSCLNGVGLPVNAAVLKDSVEQVHLLMFAQDLPVPVEKVAGIIDLAAVQLRDGSGHEIQPVVLGEIAEELNGGTARLLCIRPEVTVGKGAHKHLRQDRKICLGAGSLTDQLRRPAEIDGFFLCNVQLAEGHFDRPHQPQMFAASSSKSASSRRPCFS